MRRYWNDYGLAIVLFALFAVSTVLQAYFDIMVENESWGHFFAALFENWQSEFLQLFTFVVLAKYLIYKGSPQSKDGDDQMKAMLSEMYEKTTGKPAPRD